MTSEPACKYQCASNAVARCDNESQVGGGITVLCTLPKGHAGKHIACALTAHCVTTWDYEQERK